jgi:ubiquinone/menaquinone biosynthesis C-methylase UbiE
MNTRGRYQRIARLYDFLDAPFERKRYAPIRPTMFEGLSGDVLDAGIGTGHNIPYYPKDAWVAGIDLSAAMLERARQRRENVGRHVPLVEMDVTRAAFKAESFDAVVSSFMFCVLDDALQLPALKELARICKPGGEIRLLEYSYSEDPRRRFIMRLWAPWVYWAYGARFNRNTHQYVEAAGLELVENRFLIDDILRLIVARRP